MKKIFLDTDIGSDCDDAGALTLLCNLHLQEKCEILAVTSTTSRKGATKCIKAISDLYNVKFPIGSISEDFLGGEEDDVYAKFFESNDSFDEYDSVELFREIAEKATEKFTLVVIGPQRNVAKFLSSKADKISSKSGIELFEDKIERVCIMGGCFQKNSLCGNHVEVEYNIAKDIQSAQFVAKHCPVETLYYPFELGNVVITGKNILNQLNSVGKIYRCFNNNGTVKRGRQSWDPITSYCAVFPDSELFSIQKRGEIVIEDDGKCRFIEDERGNRFCICAIKDASTIENELDEFIK